VILAMGSGRGRQPYRNNGAVRGNFSTPYGFDVALNPSDDSDDGSSLSNFQDDGLYSDEEEQYIQYRTTAEVPIEGNGDQLLSEQESGSAPRASPNMDRAENGRAFHEMTMMQMARYMFNFTEVRNAIQDFDQELFVKIANIIFSETNLQ
uniref:Bindin n=1 Tax=Haemonchus contortus TaxID=6289 RepID=A0A7I4YV94_HAECO